MTEGVRKGKERERARKRERKRGKRREVRGRGGLAGDNYYPAGADPLESGLNRFVSGDANS